MPKKTVYATSFFLLLVLTLWGIGRVLEPFTGALLGAIVVALTFYPFHRRVGRWITRGGPNLHALATVLAIFIFLITPIALLGWLLGQESEALANLTHTWSQTIAQWQQGHVLTSIDSLHPALNWIRRVLGIRPVEFEHQIVNRLEQVAGFATRAGGEMAQNVLIFLFQMALMLFTLFFLFRDGPKYERRLEALFPMPAADTRELMDRVHDTVVGVVRGWLLTSLVQGVCATIGYLIARVPGAVLLGFLTAAIGLIPVVGTFAVWVPIGLFLLVKGAIWQGVFVLLWGTLIVVGFVDTVARPYLVGHRAEMPLLPLLFALLGGVEVWGAKGIILGPLLIAIAPLLFEIYRKRYLNSASAHLEA